ncbi:MAG: hypothetical protein NXI24_01305 [bacterium]|nr:hypothetical protein [bacterium]
MTERNDAVIRHVILYKHGIGYFKREALVEGDGVIELQFKTKEMNDVLKSLTVYDADGGLVPGISYEGEAGQTPGDTGLEYPHQRALSGLLANLIGVRLTLTIGDAEISGEILGLESFPADSVPAGRRSEAGAAAAGDHLHRNREQTRLLLRCDDGPLRSFNILEVEAFRLLDEKVDQDVSHQLTSTVYWKKKAARKITIHSRGSGERRLILGYAIEAPVWKTSYRILLPERSALAGGRRADDSASAGALRLQGWALVDNPHDEDWDDVRLSLVAGLPVSFTHDLYSPRYQQRPEIAVDRGVAYGAPEVQAGSPPAPPKRMKAKSMAPPGGPAMASMDLMEIGEFSEEPDEIVSGFPGHLSLGGIDDSFAPDVDVSGGELDGGNAYVYHLEHPVSVGRGQSALVPILAADFEGERVALYSPQIRATNPMACILLKNSTDSTLEGGPATVFDQESYAGEGMLKLFKPGETQFVPYAVELGCRIARDNESIERGVYRSLIVNGAWSMFHRRLALAIYKIDNRANPYPLELFIEHDIRHGWSLADAAAGDPGIALDSDGLSEVVGELHESTPEHYRFRMSVPAGETVRFIVREMGEYTNNHNIGALDRDSLSAFAARGYLDEATRKLIEELIGLQSRAAELKRELRDCESESQNLSAGQERLRENLKSFSGRADEEDLRKRYLTQFKQDEDRFEELRAENSRINGELQEIQSKRDRLLAEASLDLMVQNS